ncbi:MAG: Electron transporter [Pedobacter sp.]|jgi:protein SCO1/2|nr:Electron transporter [Pedobacter sp.]
MRHLPLRILLLFCAVLLVFNSCTKERKLPIYGNRDTKIVKHADGSSSIDTVYQTIPDFTFLNQDSVKINNNTFKNKVYVADFFFTSCPSICPIMHRNLKKVYEDFKGNPEVMFLSHTIDYKYDTPHILKKYAAKLGVDDKKWQFAYGKRNDIYTIAEKSYLVAVQEDSTEKGSYVHQGWLILIDKDRKMRGIYDGTDSKAVEKLGKDIPTLLAEYKK